MGKSLFKEFSARPFSHSLVTVVQTNGNDNDDDDDDEWRINEINKISFSPLISVQPTLHVHTTLLLAFARSAHILRRCCTECGPTEKQYHHAMEEECGASNALGSGDGG